MTRLRQRLFELYDQHYLRANLLQRDAIDSAVYESHVRDYECEFGCLLTRAPQNAPIVDIGCGMGLLLYWLSRTRSKQFSLAGVDLSEAQLGLARKNLPGGVEIFCDTGAAYLRKNPGRYSAVFCTDLLEHIEGDDDLLELLELSREALVPGGLFVCRVPNMANLAGSHLRYIDMTHTRGFTATSLVQLLEGAGYSKAWIEPRQAADASQWLRIRIEYLLHWTVFRICGVGTERHYGRTIVGVGQVE
jgi:2-polyprenyl-3-methyl-5-hydroxy-6-metoxy-1,4-benzoquinol methylase